MGLGARAMACCCEIIFWNKVGSLTMQEIEPVGHSEYNRISVHARVLLDISGDVSWISEYIDERSRIICPYRFPWTQKSEPSVFLPNRQCQRKAKHWYDEHAAIPQLPELNAISSTDKSISAIEIVLFNVLFAFFSSLPRQDTLLTWFEWLSIWDGAFHLLQWAIASKMRERGR